MEMLVGRSELDDTHEEVSMALDEKVYKKKDLFHLYEMSFIQVF